MEEKNSTTIQNTYTIVNEGNESLKSGKGVGQSGVENQNGTAPASEASQPLSGKEFVMATIMELEQEAFSQVKQGLLDRFISFSVIPKEEITTPVLAEKMCGYFQFVENKAGKSFEKLLGGYMNDWVSLLEPHIAKTPSAKKNDTAPVIVPRARKYFEKAQALRSSKCLTITELTDFSRLMMCLYAAVCENKGGVIDNFDFAVDSLKPDVILEAMEKEEITAKFPASKKKRFNLKDPFGTDSYTMVISLIMLWAIINGKGEGEKQE